MPDNNIEWGQGGVNNNNDWGKAKANSTNNFGAVYDSSPSGDTNIAGGQPVVSITYSASAFCADASDPTPTVSNNAGAGTFASTTGLVINSTTGVVDIDASTAGSYLITYTDTDAATATFNFTINALPSVTVSVSAGTICVGESTTITATGAASYVWSNGSTGNSITVSPTTTTTFTATGTDSNGCTSSGGTTITVNTLPTVEITGTLTYCVGSTTTLTATAGLSSYLWSTGATTQAINVTAGSYTVTGTDSNGCSATSSASTVTELPLDSATVTYSAASYCQMPTGALAVDGYYPLYSTASAANAVSSDGTNHTHTLGGVTYYMPNAGVIAYHGTYSLTTPAPTITGESGTFTAAEKFFPFQMQFDTSGGKTITIPGTVGSSFTVDWGDGNTTTETGGTISHTYASGLATSIVSIGAQDDTGVFGGLRFNNGGSKTDLLEIQQWGSIEFINLLLGFYGCSNMQITATDSPNLLLSGSGSSTSFQQTFFNCTALTGNSYMNNWDVSNVTNMFYAFANTAFNADISNWDVSSVTSFSRCFQGCSNFNQDISSWDMSSVTDASFMLYYATSFNQPIGSWNLTSATTIYQMLIGASSFNQNIGGWSLRTASTPNMGYLLYGTTSMSNANSTDSVVGWANYVYNNTAPFNVSLTNSNINAKFDGTRSGGANFATAADAKTYLTTTAGWSIN